MKTDPTAPFWCLLSLIGCDSAISLSPLISCHSPLCSLLLPTWGFHFLNHTMLLPASRLCTGRHHCLQQAGPRASRGWSLSHPWVSAQMSAISLQSSPLSTLSKLGPSPQAFRVSLTPETVWALFTTTLSGSSPAGCTMAP